jgi:hypothetical protein
MAASRRGDAAEIRGLLLAAVLAAIAVNVLVTVFIRHERSIYFWDYLNYWSKYGSVTALFCSHPRTALHALLTSIRYEDYNFLPVYPLIPFGRVLGPGRLSYILAVSNVYAIPAAFSSALIFRTPLYESVDGGVSRLTGQLIAVVTCILLPQFWSATLYGYLDVVGVVLINAACFIYLRQPLEKSTARALVLLGLLLATVVVLRRWYAYWVVAFFVAAAAERLVGWLSGPRESARAQAAWLGATCAVGALALGTYFAIATPVARVMLRTNQADLNSAAMESGSFLEVLGRYVDRFGPLVVAMFLVSSVYLLVREQTRRGAVFLLAQFAVCMVLFGTTQDFGSHHYYLLVPSMVAAISLGVVSAYRAIDGRTARRLALAVYVALLLVNCAVVFVPGAAAHVGPAGALLSRERHPPMVRHDLAELQRLWTRLSALAEGNDGKIYVLASSNTLNNDIVRRIPADSFAPCLLCRRIAYTSHIDKRDGLMRDILEARWMVVGAPIQYHMRPEGQRVIGIPAREILSGQGIGVAYRKLDDEFSLDHGVKVYIYERVRPLEPAAEARFWDEFTALYPNLVKGFPRAPGTGQAHWGWTAKPGMP